MASRLLIGAGVLAVLGIGGAAALWLLSAPSRLDPEVAVAMDRPGDATAGKLVFFAGGCNSCHMTPGQDDPTKLGGGLELKTPFGIFYPPNISPDPQTGIGAWSARQFAASIYDGVSPEGEHEYPVFPYGSYRHMAIADVRDLFAYLRTLPPVTSTPPPHRLSFPFNFRRAVGLWKQLYLRRVQPVEAPPPVSDALAYGRYLVEGAGHCGECHTPRDPLGGPETSKRLGGAPMPDGKGKAPAITAKGLADWSEDDVESALATGFTPIGDTLGGAMAEVVRNLSHLPTPEVAAIAHFLKSPLP